MESTTILDEFLIHPLVQHVIHTTEEGMQIFRLIMRHNHIEYELDDDLFDDIFQELMLSWLMNQRMEAVEKRLKCVIIPHLKRWVFDSSTLQNVTAEQTEMIAV